MNKQTDQQIDEQTDKGEFHLKQHHKNRLTDKHKNKQTYKQTDKGEFHLKQQQFHDAYSGDAPSHAITH